MSLADCEPGRCASRKMWGVNCDYETFVNFSPEGVLEKLPRQVAGAEVHKQIRRLCFQSMSAKCQPGALTEDEEHNCPNRRNSLPLGWSDDVVFVWR